MLETTLFRGTLSAGRQSLEARHTASLSSGGECPHAVQSGADGLI